jgi:hypothetical protein
MPARNRNANPDLPGYKGPGGGKYGKLRDGIVGAGLSIPDELGPALHSCVNAVLASGDAVMFSRTASGGIICVAVYSGQEKPEKFYARDEDELADWLVRIKEAAQT